MEIGVLLALTAALFSSLKGIARKHISRDFSSVQIGFIGQVYGVVLLLPFAAWRYLQVGLTLDAGVLTALLMSTLIIISSTYIYIEALRITDISVAEPLRNTSPIFVALLEPLILGINFEALILSAALLGTIGTYVVVSKDSLLTPLKNIGNKGALMSLLVAFILSLYSIAQRFGATNTDPLLFVYMAYITSLVGFWIWKRREGSTVAKEDYFRKDAFVLGTVTAFGVVAGIFAYSLISASEVTVVKQTSVIFGVLIGGTFFSEKDLVRKLVGSLIIIAGVVLLTI